VMEPAGPSGQRGSRPGVGAVLDHEMTERAVDRAFASPDLERLVIRVL
jgi:hypothetical protein